MTVNQIGTMGVDIRVKYYGQLTAEEPGLAPIPDDQVWYNLEKDELIVKIFYPFYPGYFYVGEPSCPGFFGIKRLGYEKEQLIYICEL
jgi:hypothetical protein